MGFAPQGPEYDWVGIGTFLGVLIPLLLARRSTTRTNRYSPTTFKFYDPEAALVMKNKMLPLCTIGTRARGRGWVGTIVVMKFAPRWWD